MMLKKFDYNIDSLTLQPIDVDLGYFKLWIMLDQISLKYKRFTLSDCKDIGFRKFKFVAKTQFLSYSFEFVCKFLQMLKHHINQ